MECRVSHSGNDETHWRLKSTSSLTIYPKLQFKHLQVSVNFHLLMHMTWKDVKKKDGTFLLKKQCFHLMVQGTSRTPSFPFSFSKQAYYVGVPATRTLPSCAQLPKLLFAFLKQARINGTEKTRKRQLKFLATSLTASEQKPSYR